MKSTKHYLGLDVDSTNMVLCAVDRESPNYRKGKYTNTSQTHQSGALEKPHRQAERRYMGNRDLTDKSVRQRLEFLQKCSK